MINRPTWSHFFGSNSNNSNTKTWRQAEKSVVHSENIHNYVWKDSKSKMGVRNINVSACACVSTFKTFNKSLKNHIFKMVHNNRCPWICCRIQCSLVSFFCCCCCLFLNRISTYTHSIYDHFIFISFYLLAFIFVLCNNLKKKNEIK